MRPVETCSSSWNLQMLDIKAKLVVLQVIGVLNLKCFAQGVGATLTWWKKKWKTNQRNTVLQVGLGIMRKPLEWYQLMPNLTEFIEPLSLKKIACRQILLVHLPRYQDLQLSSWTWAWMTDSCKRWYSVRVCRHRAFWFFTRSSWDSQSMPFPLNAESPTVCDLLPWLFVWEMVDSVTDVGLACLWAAKLGGCNLGDWSAEGAPSAFLYHSGHH